MTKFEKGELISTYKQRCKEHKEVYDLILSAKLLQHQGVDILQFTDKQTMSVCYYISTLEDKIIDLNKEIDIELSKNKKVRK